MALAWVSAGTRAFTQARAAKLLVEEATAKSRVLLIVGSEATEKAPVPELDHWDQPAGKLPKAVELKVSASQGDADGAWRGSKASSCGITRRGDVLLIGGLEVGQAQHLRLGIRPKLNLRRKIAGAILWLMLDRQAQVPFRA